MTLATTTECWSGMHPQNESRRPHKAWGQLCAGHYLQGLAHTMHGSLHGFKQGLATCSHLMPHGLAQGGQACPAWQAAPHSCPAISGVAQ